VKISAKTTVTSLATLFILVLFGGLIAYISVSFITNSLRTNEAERRIEFLEASIREDSLQNKDRAAKAALAADPGSYFPGMTYCDVFVVGNANGEVIESYIDPGFTSISPQKVLAAYITMTGETPKGTPAGGRYGVLQVGNNLVSFGAAPTKPNAFLIVGKVIDVKYLQKLTRLNEYEVKVIPYNKAIGDEAAAAKTALNQGHAVYLASEARGWTTIYGLLRDPPGHPVGIIKAVTNTSGLGYGPWIVLGALVLMLIAGIGVVLVNVTSMGL
jgi:hypothetical protein